MILKFGMGSGYIYPPTEYGYREVETVGVNCRKLKELKKTFRENGIIDQCLYELVPGNEKYNINNIKIIINPYNGIAQEFYNIYFEDIDKNNNDYTKNRIGKFINNFNENKNLIIFFEKIEFDGVTPLFHYGFIIGEPLYVMNNQGKTVDFYSGN